MGVLTTSTSTELINELKRLVEVSEDLKVEMQINNKHQYFITQESVEEEDVKEEKEDKKKKGSYHEVQGDEEGQCCFTGNLQKTAGKSKRFPRNLPLHQLGSEDSYSSSALHCFLRP